MFFKKKQKEEFIKKEFECQIENAEQKQLERIYNTDFSIVDIYIKEYKNGTALKVLILDNDKIIGDIPSDKVQELLDFHKRTGKIYVNNYLNDEGKMIYKGFVTFEKTVKKEM